MKCLPFSFNQPEKSTKPQLLSKTSKAFLLLVVSYLRKSIIIILLLRIKKL